MSVQYDRLSLDLDINIDPELAGHDSAIALLEGWLSVREADEDNERLKAFVTALDEDRLSERRLFVCGMR